MDAPRKGHSLHIGLNAVDPRHYAGWTGALVACEADAVDMERIAVTSGFAARVLLKTPDATRDRVIEEIRKAAAGLVKGDLFFLTYSGHGGQVPDLHHEEDDGRDETWCLFDGELLDDELHALWQGFASGVRILVLADCCHSGTTLRAAPPRPGATLVEEGVADQRPRFRAMPRGAAIRTYMEHKEFYDGLQARTPGDRGEVQASVRLISGCQDNQKSSDGDFNGLFTGTLLQVWRGGAFQGSYRDFHSAIVRRMPAVQTPNHYTVGRPDAAFDAQKPFTI